MLPELSLGASVSLPTYFVFLSLLYSFLIFAAWKWAQKQGVSEIHALNLSILLVVSGMVGGRLFHVFYEAPAYYRENPFDIFKFWLGGFVFYGGMLTAAIAAVIYLHRTHESFFRWADFFAPLFALGYGLGRIACLLAGCCYGRVCDLPWAINGRHPTQLYATLIELCFAALLFALTNVKRRQLGELFFLWLGLHACGRLFMEYFRDDFRGDFVLGVSISSWISLFLLSLSITMLVRTRFLQKA